MCARRGINSLKQLLQLLFSLLGGSFKGLPPLSQGALGSQITRPRHGESVLKLKSILNNPGFPSVPPVGLRTSCTLDLKWKLGCVMRSQAEEALSERSLGAGSFFA